MLSKVLKDLAVIVPLSNKTSVIHQNQKMDKLLTSPNKSIV